MNNEIYVTIVEAFTKEERQDETQFTTKIHDFFHQFTTKIELTNCLFLKLS
jgi:hypothetical protein